MIEWEKAPFPIDNKSESFTKSTMASFMHWKKADSPINLTLFGIVTFSIDECLKAKFPIEINSESLSNSTESKSLHSSKEFDAIRMICDEITASLIFLLAKAIVS